MNKVSVKIHSWNIFHQMVKNKMGKVLPRDMKNPTPKMDTYNEIYREIRIAFKITI